MGLEPRLTADSQDLESSSALAAAMEERRKERKDDRFIMTRKPAQQLGYGNFLYWNTTIIRGKTREGQ
jgi:hypothetical protein